MSAPGEATVKVAVADTSALIRLFVPDGPLPDGFESAIDAAGRGDLILLVPDLATAEAAQVLHKKEQGGLLKRVEADEILALLLALPFETVGHAPYLPRAVALARTHRLTVYDALFLAVATARHATLYTADAKLRKAAKRLGALG
ncbi:MAG: PIN domain-containing protein [Myxococcales bacterium]|nr:PIN domain-containing protein [Myxococcales bacterium]